MPTIWQGVRSALENADDETRSKFCVERVLCGGSGVPSDLMEFFLSRYKTQFFQGWGMTELSPNGSVGRLDVKREHASWTREEQFSNVQKAGLLHPGLEARIIDVNCGSCCSHNELVVEDGVASGELIIRGPYVTQEYFNHPTSTEEAFVDLNDGGSTWLRTGDIASIDAGGTIEISDRAKDLIKSGGEWISSYVQYVLSCLSSLPPPPSFSHSLIRSFALSLFLSLSLSRLELILKSTHRPSKVYRCVPLLGETTQSGMSVRSLSQSQSQMREQV